MRMFRSIGRRLRSPAAIYAIATLLLLFGIGIIVQNEANYREVKLQEIRVQAKILAASATPALDFEDPRAAQEAVDAFKANAQVRWIAIFGGDGRLVAGYHAEKRGLPTAETSLPEQAGGSIRTTVPIVSGGQSIGTVYFEADREPLSRRVARYFLLGVLVMAAALVVTVLGFSQVALRRANRELAERADALADANTSLEVQMDRRAKAEEQLRQAQKMQALGQLTGGIAHDFNNLLTVIQGSADMLCRDEVTDQRRIRFARAIVEASTSAASLTAQLLAFSRRQPLEAESLDLNQLVQSMEDLIGRTLGERIDVQTRLAPEADHVLADRAQLQAAILNIAANARDAMPDGGRLTITTRAAGTRDGRQMVALEISDTGTGMDRETLDRVFEPFFTTKGVGQGTGLGLSQVYGFVSQSGGQVEASSVPGYGSTFRLLLPLAAAPIETPAAETRSVAGPDSTASILVVEDNEEVGAFAETLLTELGHSVTRARSGEEALEIARKRTFDVVFSDVVMPGIGGLELSEILRQEQPHLPVVLATGYSQEIARSGSRGRPVILKPYRVGTLSEALNKALQKAA
jgi:signal transduction histidine kinase